MIDLSSKFQPNSLKDIIQQLAKRKGWDDQWIQAELKNRWEKIVGEKIASETEIDSFKEGVLSIRTKSSTWRTELNLRAEQLIIKINEELQSDEVEKIVIR